MGDNIENRKEEKKYIEVKLTIRTTKTITIITTTTVERQNESSALLPSAVKLIALIKKVNEQQLPLCIIR